VLRNVGSTWVLTLVTIVVTYALTPFVIHTLGQDGYGTWTLITAMTGYMGLLALASRWPPYGTSPSTWPKATSG
jgi:O-antigen/teichoic acid export membrane protein